MIKLLANKYVLGALGLAVLVAFVWGYGRYQYGQGVTDTETAAQLAAAEQYVADVKRINNSIGVLQAYIEELENAKPRTITEYRTRTVEVPLPADCRIDDGRLRTIQDGIERARTAGQPGRRVP
ncbi:hypothetical protein [Pusillimonas noertemannii]|uniref:Uncharacterized protein n=1 Tax=Pusillimonas noertemannii TaxID=305977 RepID=A0A2U1CS73_9BURK|nr:hypothetical protein [Pusillimonas noertemannii]NYT67996.1 hypothetical protein [Pusillimonas noertemannii]PVY68674.1 hypothetical protein C7440_1085 [Pusillimonas noertemannii]TFL11865.1 hypothetical protein CSC72_01665 [Pusillimonas noertemannii]